VSIESSSMAMTFLIADLAGYTALAGAHGDLDAAQAAARFASLAEMACVDSRVLKTVGDAVIIVSHEPEGALRSALRLKHLVASEDLFPDVSMGLSSGPAVERNGDFLGQTVNIAARVCSHARAG
jgi:adenylate cyclase